MEQKNATIIKFPASKIVRENMNIEVVNQAKTKGTLKYADLIIENIMDDIDQHIQANGLNVSSELFDKDYQYIFEVMRSMIYRTLNLKHPIQEYVEKHVVVDSGEEDAAEVKAE